MEKCIQIPYGKTVQNLHINEKNLNAVLLPKENALSAGDEGDIVQAALDDPIASPKLCELARDKKRIVLITSDHTRPVPSRVTMPPLLREIRKYNHQADITILIATGMHRPTTKEELIQKCGADIVENEKIVIHNAFRQEGMAFFGILPSGGELWLNKLLKQADLVLSEGFIEPHFFAGFSGGRKSILPGVASGKTVMYNHNARFIASPFARQGNLKNNPLHRDMLFAARQARLQFILNVILDENKKIIAAVAGDPEKAHEEGCAICDSRMRLEPVVSDIAITSNGGYPLDQNISQSVKGMTAAEKCVRPGGVIIMNAALGDGHGGAAFFNWFAARSGPKDVMRNIENVPPEETTADQWEAQILARIMLKAACIFVTGEENRALVESMHMRWAPNSDAALKDALNIVGENGTVTVIPDGVGVII